jgi:protein XagA
MARAALARAAHFNGGSAYGLRFYGFLLAPVLCASQGMAGALLLPEGEGQAIVTTTFADANMAFDYAGRPIRTPPYRKFEILNYVEYGLTDGLTVVAEAGLTDFRSSYPFHPGAPASVSHYEGLGVAALGARVPLGELMGAYASLEASARAAPRDAWAYLDLKNRGQADIRLQLFKTTEIGGYPAFFEAQTGFRTSGPLGDEVRADLTFGLRPRADVLVLAQSFSAASPRTPAGAVAVAQKFEISGVYDIDHRFSLQLGLVGAPVGWNGPAERGAVSALWWRF